jgi:hypothetical protein
MHNLQTTSTDLLRVITGSAADLDCIVSFIEATQASPPVPDWPETQFTNILTATTTTILAAPNASSIRKIKGVSIVNTHASASTTVRVIIERTGPVNWDCFNTITLQPGESLTFTEGLGWFYNKSSLSVPVGTTNLLTGADLTLSTTDIYLSNSSLKLDGLGPPTVGRGYHWAFVLSKTAGTAAPVLTVRTGTAGSIADTSRVVFTWGIGTSVTDRAEFEIDVRFITVGAGTSAVLRGKGNFTNNLGDGLTGFSGTTHIAALQPADSGGFDSTAAGLLIGLSWNGSAVFAGALEYMAAWTDQL